MDDQGTALWQGKPAHAGEMQATVVGLTKSDYGYRYCDVSIRGFVIRVDKMEEPQWGHKFPEKEED